MKSKFSLILIVVVVAVVAVLVYFFVIKKPESETPVTTNSVSNSGLVSTNTGAAQGLQNQSATATGTSQTGSQVVQILRNLSVIQLDDAVFRNPAFAYLTDVTIALPPATNQGRRNPFGPIGSESATTTTAASNGLAPTTQ